MRQSNALFTRHVFVLMRSVFSLSAHAIAFGDFRAGYTIAERPDLRILRGHLKHKLDRVAVDDTDSDELAS